MNLSKKVSAIKESETLLINAKVKEMRESGIDVISFGAGEPDFDTPEHIKAAAIKAINNGFTKYTAASGMIELKQAVCDKLKNENNLIYDTSNIVISNGAKHSLNNVFRTILCPGDEVLIPIPYWVSYPEIIKLSDGIPVMINTAKTEFRLTAESVEKLITPKTKAIIINSPNNPTGMVYKQEELEKIAKLACKNNIYVVSDEIYGSLIYTQNRVKSIANFNSDIKNLTIVVNGVSKTYSMTGWRIGYTASNSRIAKLMSNLQSHTTSNPNSIAQIAAIEALNGGNEDVIRMLNSFKKRRDYMVERINKIDGLSCLIPDGAFYVWVNIEKLKDKVFSGVKITNSDDVTNILLEFARVAVVSGKSFGSDKYIRLSFAISDENIKNGLDRIENFLST